MIERIFEKCLNIRYDSDYDVEIDSLEDLKDAWEEVSEIEDAVETHTPIVNRASSDFPISHHVLAEEYWMVTEQGELHPDGYRDRVREELGRNKGSIYEMVSESVDKALEESELV